MRWWRWLVFSFVGTEIAMMLAFPAVAQSGGQGLLQDALGWVEALGIWGSLAFIGLYIVVTVAFLPASIVTLSAGVIFGVFQGTLLVFMGAMLGATAAFVIGRFVARERVAKLIAGNARFEAINEAIGREGRKIIFLIRLSPAFPFNVLNYALGLTPVSLSDYVVGTTGILPGTLMYVYLGSLAGDLAMIGSSEQPTNAAVIWTIRIIGFIATVAVTVYVTRIARKALATVAPTPEESAS